MKSNRCTALLYKRDISTELITILASKQRIFLKITKQAIIKMAGQLNMPFLILVSQLATQLYLVVYIHQLMICNSCWLLSAGQFLV